MLAVALVALLYFQNKEEGSTTPADSARTETVAPKSQDKNEPEDQAPRQDDLDTPFVPEEDEVEEEGARDEGGMREQDEAPVVRNVEVVLTETSKPTQTPTPQHVRTSAIITYQDIIDATNEYRATLRLKPLRYNQRLSRSAEAKVDLIFAEQHFAHTARNGKTMSDLIQAAGYEVIRSGENLALGHYKDGKGIVEAWKNSPGHNQMLISPHFVDIGVSVKQGRFDGNTVWVAVQHFGKPLSLCQHYLPSEVLKDTIAKNQQRHQDLYVSIQEQKSLIDSFTVPAGERYSAVVDKYNAIVAEYNQLSEVITYDIDSYNQQIQRYNTCVAE